MKKIVISLASATERRTHIRAQFDIQNIEFEFYDAVTPVPARHLAEHMELPIRYDLLTGGELACFMSHVSVWKKVIDHNIDYVAVFEDDVVLSNQAAIYLNNHDWIPKGYHFIKTEAFWPKANMAISGIALPYGNRKLFRLFAGHVATAGYILSNAAAHSLFEYVKKYESRRPIDHIMFEHYIYDGEYQVFQMNPALCIQDDVLNRHQARMPSMLEHDRRQRINDANPNRKIKLTPTQKIMREVMRPFFQLLKLLTLKHLLSRRVHFK
ncbi:MAG: glycosyltransferase family 25 protein [Moraxellaceae bacterium]